MSQATSMEKFKSKSIKSISIDNEYTEYSDHKYNEYLPEYSKTEHFLFIREAALMLGFESHEVDELEYRSFVWEEVGLIRQFTKVILEMSGGRTAADFIIFQNETDVSTIGMAIWDSARAMLAMLMDGKDCVKDCVKHCSSIIAATWKIEELLLNYAWRGKSRTTLLQKAWIKGFRDIREHALQCEFQYGKNAVEKVQRVQREIDSIQKLAKKILQDCGASFREQVDEEEDSDVSDIFGSILDVTADMLVGAGHDYVSACSQIIHATHRIEELNSWPMNREKVMKVVSENRNPIDSIDQVQQPEKWAMKRTASTSSASYAETVPTVLAESDVDMNFSSIETDSTARSSTESVSTNIKISIVNNEVKAEFVSARPQDCMPKSLPWSPEGHRGAVSYCLWIEKQICLHYVAGTCVKNNGCKWLHPNHVEIWNALLRLVSERAQ